MVASFSLYLMSLLYIVAGIFHFVKPKFFLKITPKWVPKPAIVNIVVGTVEVILGVVVLIPSIRSMAALAIIFLLLIVFPANIYHFQKAWRKQKGVAVTLLRLPMQVLLIWWAYSFI